jgi:hypothetical protein
MVTGSACTGGAMPNVTARAAAVTRRTPIRRVDLDIFNLLS